MSFLSLSRTSSRQLQQLQKHIRSRQLSTTNAPKVPPSHAPQPRVPPPPTTTTTTGPSTVHHTVTKSSSGGRFAGFVQRLTSFFLGAGLTALATQYYIYQEIQQGNTVMITKQLELERRMINLERK